MLRLPLHTTVGQGEGKEEMFTFSQSNFSSSSAYPPAEYKEVGIQACMSFTLTGFDAGTQATMNTLRHSCHLGGP